jgi:hypothetical protein
MMTQLADVITLHITNETAKTLTGMGASFVYGCVALALGVVIAFLIQRRK